MITSLTKKQSAHFVEFYLWLYGDTSKETGTGELPIIRKGEEDWHRILWEEEIRKMLPSSTSNKDLEKVFNNLRFNFGPKIYD